MKIGIHGRGLSVEVGGAKTYLERLTHALARVDREDEIVLFHNSPAHRGTFAGVREVCFSAPGAWAWENVALPLAVRRERPDVLLCPKNLIPWALPRSVRTVVVILDLLYFPLRGQCLDEYLWRDVAYMRLFLRDSLRRAARIVAISENTRRDLLDLFDLDPARVVTIHLGVEPPGAEDVREDRLAAVRRKYGLDRPYVFYAGSLSPRKNIRRAVEAFAAVARGLPHEFVVTAGKSWKDREVYAAVERLGLAPRFRKLGSVPDADLPALYRMADLFVYPSLYEGFGLPILEAMACGCPVLASNSSSIPEVAGDAALLVNPLDTDGLVAGMRKILTDSAHAADLRERGLSRSQEFSWEKCARKFVDVLRSVAEAG